MKRKIMLGASAGFIAALAVAGAAFAQEGPDGRNSEDSIKDRIAEILKVKREDLDTAINKARGEYQDINQDEKLLSLVQDGLITQARADEIKKWSRSRPSAMDELNRFRRGPDGNSGIEARLLALVELEVVSQKEADEVIAWIDSKPKFLKDICSDRGDKRGRRDQSRQWRSEERSKYFNKHTPNSEPSTTFTLQNGRGIKL
tara:strand:+ start:79 stop:684 length:606 start_codon:yes stop_codon:yes gene_type:complete